MRQFQANIFLKNGQVEALDWIHGSIHRKFRTNDFYRYLQNWVTTTRKWTIPEKNGLASIKYCLDWRCLLCNSLFLHLINGKLCCICGYVIVPDRRIAQLVRVSDSYIQQCLKKGGNFCFSLRHLLLVKTSFSWSQRTCLSCFSSVRPPGV